MWDRKELDEHIRVAIKEHEMMEMMLGELEDEYEEAMHKIKILETKLQDLKDENHCLKEVHGKSKWDTIKHNKEEISPWISDRYRVLTDTLRAKMLLMIVTGEVPQDTLGETTETPSQENQE
uniref:Uncharacterized protein n=1 Tax=Helianthus annuus TaxID=4232 RepID=A0A251UVQ7_HELAN